LIKKQLVELLLAEIISTVYKQQMLLNSKNCTSMKHFTSLKSTIL